MAEIKRYESASPVEKYAKERGGFYEVDGKLIPDAAAVISEGVNKGISTYIKAYHADERGVEVVVLARTRDGVEAEEWVRLEYVTEAYKLFLQKMKKEIISGQLSREELISGGTMETVWGKIPAFNDPALQFKYIDQLMRMYSYLPRIAVTKAKNRAILQLLGREFRDEEEIEHERMEVEEVNEAKNASNLQNEVKISNAKLSDAQLRYIHKLIAYYAELSGTTEEAIKATIKKQLGVKHMNELTRQQASKLIDALNKKINELQAQKAMGDIAQGPAPSATNPQQDVIEKINAKFEEVGE